MGLWIKEKLMNKVFTQMFGFAEFIFYVADKSLLRQPSEGTQLITAIKLVTLLVSLLSIYS